MVDLRCTKRTPKNARAAAKNHKHAQRDHHQQTKQNETKQNKAGAPRSFEELEAELLAGQKLQGVLTSNEVQAILRAR